MNTRRLLINLAIILAIKSVFMFPDAAAGQTARVTNVAAIPVDDRDLDRRSRDGRRRDAAVLLGAPHGGPDERSL